MTYSEEMQNKDEYDLLRKKIRQDIKDVVLLDKFTDLSGEDEDSIQYCNYLMGQVQKNVLRMNKVVNKMEDFDES
jgi:hypothetical protein